MHADSKFHLAIQVTTPDHRIIIRRLWRIAQKGQHDKEGLKNIRDAMVDDDYNMDDANDDDDEPSGLRGGGDALVADLVA